MSEQEEFASPVLATASWTYLRMHVGRASPRPCYGEQSLRSWGARLNDLGPSGDDGWVFFNNDHAACAVRDAARFERLVAGVKRGQGQVGFPRP